MNKIISLSHVEKVFRSKKVLDIAELSVFQGEIISILGTNGAGKSTLIKLISGLLLQEKGKIEVMGISNDKRKIHQKVKFVMESGKGYYDYLTSEQNIEYFLKLNNLRLADVKNKLDILCQDLDFADSLPILVSELSQGNRQKLSLIVALLCEPQILCLDEPSNGLDLLAKRKIEEILLQMRTEQKTTILITTHDIAFAQKISSRILIMDKGKILMDGTFDQLLGGKKLRIYVMEAEAKEYEKIKDLSGEFEWEKDEGILRIKTVRDEIKEAVFNQISVLNYRVENREVEDIIREVLDADSRY